MRHLIGAIAVIGASAVAAQLVSQSVHPERGPQSGPSRRAFDERREHVPVETYLDAFDRAKLFGGTSTEPPPPVTCALDVLSVVLVEGMPARSLATVRDRNVFSVVQVGDEVSGALVVAVDAVRDRDGMIVAGLVELERDGTRTRCAGGSGISTVLVSAPQSRDGTVLLTREAVRLAMERDVYRVRADPVRDGGAIRGWKLANVPNSVLAQVGLANGDVIRRVNGYEIAGPTRALELYAMLQNEGDFTVDYERAGKASSLRVRIQ